MRRVEIKGGGGASENGRALDECIGRGGERAVEEV